MNEYEVRTDDDEVLAVFTATPDDAEVLYAAMLDTHTCECSIYQTSGIGSPRDVSLELVSDIGDVDIQDEDYGFDFDGAGLNEPDAITTVLTKLVGQRCRIFTNFTGAGSIEGKILSISDTDGIVVDDGNGQLHIRTSSILAVRIDEPIK